MFRLLDDDDSGALDADELLDGFSAMGTKVNEAALRLLISSVDFDGSGLIELDEFEVIMVGGLTDIGAHRHAMCFGPSFLESNAAL